MRKLSLQIRPKLVRVHKKSDKRDEAREVKALSAAHLERSIKEELLERLKKGTYGDIYNFPQAQYDEALDKEEEEFDEDDEEEEEEEDGEGVEYVEVGCIYMGLLCSPIYTISHGLLLLPFFVLQDLEESDEDMEDYDYHGEGFEFEDEDEDEEEEDEEDDRPRKKHKKDAGRSGPRVEVEYENEEEGGEKEVDKNWK